MRHIHKFTDFINESKFQYETKFLTIIKELSKSGNSVVREVASLLLSTIDFKSAKFKQEEYSIEVHADDIVMVNKQPIKLGRLLVSFLPDVKLFKIEQFVQVYKSIVSGNISDYTIKILTGEDILHGYTTANYAREVSGDMHSSCMNDDFSYLELYTRNKNVSLAVCMNKDNKICARTLVWTSNDGNRSYDRVYSITAENKEALLKLLSNDKVGSIPHICTVDLEYIPEEFPYVDTMRYLDLDDKSLCNKDLSDCVILDQTDGSYSGSGGDDDYQDGDDGDGDYIYRGDVIEYIEGDIIGTLAYLNEHKITTYYEILWDALTDTKDPNDVKDRILDKMADFVNSFQYEDESSLSFVNKYMLNFIAKKKKVAAHFASNNIETADMTSKDLFKAVKTFSFRKSEDMVDYIVHSLIKELGLVKAIEAVFNASLISSSEKLSLELISDTLMATNDLYTIASKLLDSMSSLEMIEFYQSRDI